MHYIYVVAGMELPTELFEVPPKRVFGLITDSRRVRHEYLGGQQENMRVLAS